MKIFNTDKTLDIFIIIFFFLVGTMYLLQATYFLFRAHQSKHWDKVKGSIQKSKLHDFQNYIVLLYWAYLKYSYR